MIICFVGVGSNLGDSAAQVGLAAQRIDMLPGTRLLASSRLYKSEPIDAPGGDFINAVFKIETTSTARRLFNGLRAIEALTGRQRGGIRNAPRTLDLDLLLYGDAIIDEPDLQVPHPRMHMRAFVLLPLQELAPSLTIPGRGSLLQFVLRTRTQSCAPIGAALPVFH